MDSDALYYSGAYRMNVCARLLGFQSVTLLKQNLCNIHPELYKERYNFFDHISWWRDDFEDNEGRFYTDVMKSTLDRCRQNCTTIVEFLLIHGFEPKSLSQLAMDTGRLYRDLILLDMMNSMESYLKFQMSSYCAKILKQDLYAEMPESSRWTVEFFLPGYFKKFLRLKMFSKESDLKIQLAWDMNQLKRGMSPVRFLTVVEELMNHQKDMTKIVKTDEETLHSLGRTVAELFPKFDKRDISLLCSEQPLLEFQPTVPSSAACYENNRRQQGAHRVICKNLEERVKSWQFGVLTQSQDCEEDEVPPFTPILKAYPGYDVKAAFDEILETCLSTYADKPVPATVVALREPFKVRVITKSAAKANYVGVPLQKYMHSHLRTNTIFSALDHPLTTSDLSHFVELKKLNPDWNLVSGDFKGATNTINSDATCVALGTVMARLNLSNEVQDLMEKVVSAQEIHYRGALDGFKCSPDKIDGSYDADLFDRFLNRPNSAVPDVTMQTNGQLMGSILSFPLLCMINASLFRQVVEEYEGREVSLARCYEVYGLKINGDDILFIAPQKLIDLWKQKVSMVGLYLSIGKNWVHPYIFTINSQLFTIKGDKLVETKYVNWSLIHPEYNDQFTLSNYYRTVDSLQHKLLEGLTPEFRLKANELFMFANIPMLTALTAETNQNWFIPRHLGGFGLETYEDYDATVYQRRLATYMETRTTPEDNLLMKFAYSDRVVPPHLLQKLDWYNELVEPIGYVQTLEEKENKTLSQILSVAPFMYGEFDPDQEERRLVSRLRRKLTKFATEGCGSLEPMSLEAISMSIPKLFVLNEHNFELTTRTCSYGVGFRPLSDMFNDFVSERNVSFLVEDPDYYTWRQEKSFGLSKWTENRFT